MTWGAVGGAAVGAVGSYLSGKAAKPKAPKFTPYSMTGTMFGDTVFDRKNNTVKINPNETMSGFGDNFTNIANQYLGGNSPTQPFQNFVYGDVQGMMPGLFGGAMDASQVDPSIYARYDQQLGALGDTLANYGAAGGAMGLGMLGEKPQSYNDIYTQRLGLLREQAAPFEQRAFNGLNQNLFSTGRMGTTGGGLQTEAFARGLAQADTGRQLDAMGFSEGLYGRDQQYALGRNNIGSNLWANSGNMFGTAGNIFGNQFGAGQSYNDIINARAQQRMGNASTLFGFGTGMTDRDMQLGSSAVTGYMGIGNTLQEQARMGGQFGAAAAGAPVQPGGPSALGGFLTGVGGAMGNINWGNIFQPTRGYQGINPNNYNIAPIKNDFGDLKMPNFQVQGGG